MDLLVISDSHKNILNLKKVLSQVQCDYILFLGDYVADIMQFKEYIQDKLFVVRGNCDGEINCDDDLLIEINHKKIFMTHGHKYGVKIGYKNVFQKSIEMGADILVFGHTHIPFQAQLENGLIVLNPGSLGKGRLKNNTFGLINISDDGIISTKLFEVK